MAKDSRARLDTTQQSKSGEKAHKAATQKINDDKRQGSYRYGSSRKEFKNEKSRNMVMNKQKAAQVVGSGFEADDLAKKADRGEVNIERDYESTNPLKKYKVTKNDTSKQDKAIQANKTPGYKKDEVKNEDISLLDAYSSMYSEGSVMDQLKASQGYFAKRNARSDEEKAAEKKSEAESRAKTYAMHKKPDPYKARAGESD